MSGDTGHALKCQLCGSVRGWGNEVAGEPLDAANGVMATFDRSLEAGQAAAGGVSIEESFNLEPEAAEEAAASTQARQAHQIQIDIWGPHWTGGIAVSYFTLCTYRCFASCWSQDCCLILDHACCMLLSYTSCNRPAESSMLHATRQVFAGAFLQLLQIRMELCNLHGPVSTQAGVGRNMQAQ